MGSYTGSVKVLAKDEKVFELEDIDVWRQSGTISEMVPDADTGPISEMVPDADTGSEIIVPLATVGSAELEKVIEYMKNMAEENTSNEDKQAWVNKYKIEMGEKENLPLLLKTIKAANFMNVENLFYELCNLLAEKIVEGDPKDAEIHFFASKSKRRRLRTE